MGTDGRGSRRRRWPYNLRTATWTRDLWRAPRSCRGRTRPRRGRGNAGARRRGCWTTRCGTIPAPRRPTKPTRAPATKSASAATAAAPAATLTENVRRQNQRDDAHAEYESRYPLHDLPLPVKSPSWESINALRPGRLFLDPGHFDRRQVADRFTVDRQVHGLPGKRIVVDLRQDVRRRHGTAVHEGGI